MGNQPPTEPKLSEEEEKAVLGYDVTAKAVADRIRRLEANGEAGVVVLAGAGISVSAGIPDFRTPGTGLYDNLAKYDLPEPTAIFNIEYFKERPEAFCALAKEMWPGNFKPTPTHFFVKLLEQKKVLRRCFTQNIDTLEREAGIAPSSLVEAHGSFGDAHCVACQEPHNHNFLRERIMAEPPTPPRCTVCKEGLVKPDIVFFGEGLPQRFFKCASADLPAAQVLLVMGTSLSVAPFCELVTAASPHCPRLLLNRDLVGTHLGLRLGENNTADNYRDAALLMSCDRGVRLLARYLGWTKDLNALMSDYDQAHLAQQPSSSSPAASLTVPPSVEPSEGAASSSNDVDPSIADEDENEEDDEEALAKSWRGASRQSAAASEGGRSEQGASEMPSDVDHLVALLSEKFNMSPEEVRARVAAKLAGDKDQGNGKNVKGTPAQATCENDETGNDGKEQSTEPSKELVTNKCPSGLRKGFAQFKQNTSLASASAVEPSVAPIDGSTPAVNSLKSGFDKFKQNTGATLGPDSTASNAGAEQSPVAAKPNPLATHETRGAREELDFECD